jgi:hypothetical protein
MAKLVRSIDRPLEQVASYIENGILEGSVSASLEDRQELYAGDAKCIVLVFERYSYAGNNRVSMNITLLQASHSPTQVCAITSGGSQAMFWKINTWGEETFLDTLRDLLDGL